MREIRLRALHEQIVRLGSAEVGALATEHRISKETVRRDLDRLADAGLIVRTRGGAAAPGTSLMEIDPQVRATEQRAEKRAIARTLVDKLVWDGMSIALDTGSSVLEVARALRGRKLTVVTNSLPVINELAGTDCLVVVLGGSLRTRSLSMVGSLTEHATEQFHCDLAVIAAPAMTPNSGSWAGIMDTDVDGVAVKRALIRGSVKSYAVLDHTKFGRTAFMTVCNANELTGVVTDDRCGEDTVEQLRALGLDVIVAAVRASG